MESCQRHTSRPGGSEGTDSSSAVAVHASRALSVGLLIVNQHTPYRCSITYQTTLVSSIILWLANTAGLELAGDRLLRKGGLRGL